MPTPERLSILILTEDSAADSFATIKALIEKMLFLVDAEHDPSRIDFDPSTDEARRAMAANGWKCHKSRNPRDGRKSVDLIKAVATRLHHDGCFVFVHMDGDRVYAQSQEGRISENSNEFRAKILPGIGALLAKTDATERIQRVLMLVPFYSIEAWLYQNVEEALRIYEEKLHGHAKDIELFSRWGQDRTLLDEVEKVKDQVALGGNYNIRLASRGFPAYKVLAVGKSYEKAVTGLRGCSDLTQALATLRRG